MNRIAPCDKRRWFQVHCCRSVVTANPLPTPDIGMALGYALGGVIAVLLVGAVFHYLGASAGAGVLIANVVVTPESIEKKMAEVLDHLKPLKAAIEDQEKKFGAASGDLMEKYENLQTQLDALDVKMSEKIAAAEKGKSLFEALREDEGLQRFMSKPSGSYTIELNSKQARELQTKTTIDTPAVGQSTSGVLPIDRTPGIVQEARQKVFLRNLMQSRPTQLSQIDFVKVNSAPARASMQTESSLKTENAVTFNTGTAIVRTIATWIPASRQVLDDFADLYGYLQGALPYEVGLAEEVQLLTGSNTGNDLNGLVTQASAYNTALNTNSPGWKQQDIIARAVQQIMIAKEIDPTFVVLHPTDYFNILLTKDSQGRYLNMGPYADPAKVFWGLTPIVTTCIGSGNFLVGSANPVAAELRDRMGMTLELSTQHSDYWVRNMVAIRAERRVALVVYRPNSFIQGSLNTSP